MTEHHDQHGNRITYSPEDKVAIAEEITLIDMVLAGPCTEAVRIELTRQSRHLAAELAAGKYLPMWDLE
jgi:hypothetical protein